MVKLYFLETFQSVLIFTESIDNSEKIKGFKEV